MVSLGSTSSRDANVWNDDAGVVAAGSGSVLNPPMRTGAVRISCITLSVRKTRIASKFRGTSPTYFPQSKPPAWWEEINLVGETGPHAVFGADSLFKYVASLPIGVSTVPTTL